MMSGILEQTIKNDNVIVKKETFYYLLEWFGKPQSTQSTQRKIKTLCVLCALCGEYFLPRFIYPEYIKKSHKKIKTFASNRSAVSILINYIIVFSISIVLFGIVLLLYGNYIDAMVGNYQQAQYTQVGSMVADSIVGLYMTGTTGEYSKMIDLPTSISGQGYCINVTDDFLGQRSVKIYSNDRKTVVYAPLNNIDTSVAVEGMVYSSSGLVRITYNSSLNSIVLEQG